MLSLLTTVGFMLGPTRARAYARLRILLLPSSPLGFNLRCAFSPVLALLFFLLLPGVTHSWLTYLSLKLRQLHRSRRESH